MVEGTTLWFYKPDAVTQYERDNPLHPYQLEGVEYLKNARAAMLGDEMGLGKTTQAVCAAKEAGYKRILVICPAYLKEVWRVEFTRRYPALCHRPEIIQEYGGYDCLPRGFAQGVILMSYNAAAKEHNLTDLHNQFDVVILDEAHMLKNPKAKTTMGVYGAKGIIKGSKIKLPAFWALSGTFMPNYPHEFWTHTFAAGAHDISYSRWIDTFCATEPSSFGKRIKGVRTENLGALKTILSKCMLRRTKEMVQLQLPEFTHQIIAVDAAKDVDLISLASAVSLSPEEIQTSARKQEEALNGILKTLIIEGREEELFSELRKACISMSVLRQFVAKCKLSAVHSIIDEELKAREYDKIVIFAHHKSVIKDLAKMFYEYNPLVITGETPMAVRTEYVNAFQNSPKHRVVIASILAAGTGITLTAANQVVAVESDWSPHNMAQAFARLHRIGQKNAVTAREFVLKDSTDERVAYLLRAKLKAALAVYS